MDNISITGGWHQKYITSNDPNFYGYYGPFEINQANMHSFIINHPDYTYRKLLSIYTKNKIDLTKFEKIYLLFSGKPGDANIIISCDIDNENNVDISSSYFRRIITNNENYYDKDLNIVDIDISSINGSCYLGTIAAASAVNPASNTFFSINGIYLE